jgi:hypothetical protein
MEFEVTDSGWGTSFYAEAGYTNFSMKEGRLRMMLPRGTSCVKTMLTRNECPVRNKCIPDWQTGL